MTKQEWVEEVIAEEVIGAIQRFKKERPYALHQLATDTAKATVSRLHSQGVVIKVKCLDCTWSQFAEGEAAGMTPCHSCNSTGYRIEPLIKEEE